ncbi:MAG: NADH oxidase, partial [Porticoccaceae bacterium]
MSDNSSKEIRSTLTNEGILELSIVNVERPVPGDDEVLLKIEASPINPSDLALLITFAADLDSLSVSGGGDQTVASIKLHPGLLGALKPRMGQSMQVGNEGGGVVIDAG